MMNSKRIGALIGTLLLLACLPQLCVAQAFVESVWPPVVERGKVNRIQISGSQVEQVVGGWTSVPTLSVKVVHTDQGDGTRASLDLDVPPDAPLGLYGLRLATRSGLSNAVIFLIDELPVLADPQRDAVKKPTVTKLQLPACVAAPCRKAVVDRYAINVTSGQRLTFEVIGNRLGKNFDPVVTIRDSQGSIVAECDNSGGLMFDCRFEQKFSKAGNYTVEVSDARYEGESSWNYVLRIGEFPVARTAIPSLLPQGHTTLVSFPQSPGLRLAAAIAAGRYDGERFFQEVRHAPDKPATWVPVEIGETANAFEQEPNDSETTATRVTVPATLNGVLRKEGDSDWFQFYLKKGQNIEVQSAANSVGSPADLELVMYRTMKDGTTREVRRVDQTMVRDNDHNTTYVKEANFTFPAPYEGLHSLQVKDLSRRGGAQFAYRVLVTDIRPKLTLESEVARLTLPQKSFQPVPLRVTRSGFSGPITLSLIGAPPGVTLQPTTIPEDATEFVCRLTASDMAEIGLSTLQIVGRYQKADVAVEAVARTHPMIDRQTRNKDRILYALREDQRRPPFSLTDRIAVQVTPPPPFEIQLPTQDVVLPKYQTATFPIVTKRQPGFTTPLTFAIRGGQIGDEREERVQVFGRIPEASAEVTKVEATLFTRILTNYEKRRVDVTATGRHDGHNVSLTRTFLLDIRSAFSPQFEPNLIEVEPGQSVKVKLLANRVATFTGAIKLTASRPESGFIYPEDIQFEEGDTQFEFELQAKPDTSPRRYQLRFESVGFVGKYQELLRSPILTVSVKKPAPEVKKK